VPLYSGLESFTTNNTKKDRQFWKPLVVVVVVIALGAFVIAEASIFYLLLTGGMFRPFDQTGIAMAEAIASTASAILTIVLVWVTWWYAAITRRIAETNEALSARNEELVAASQSMAASSARAIEVETQPILVLAEFDVIDMSVLNRVESLEYRISATWRNIGRGNAINVSFELDVDLEVPVHIAPDVFRVNVTGPTNLLPSGESFSFSFELGVDAEILHANHALALFTVRYVDVVGNHYTVCQRHSQKPAISVAAGDPFITRSDSPGHP
jgi:hypothetical protein